MPVSSAIMTPVDLDQIIHDGNITLRGWAYSGGGRWPERVEVSADGGSVWYEVPYQRMSKKYFFGWRIWSIEVPVEYEGWLEFCCRTWDNALNTQPTFVRSAWYVLISDLSSFITTMSLTMRIGIGICMLQAHAIA